MIKLNNRDLTRKFVQKSQLIQLLGDAKSMFYII